MTHRVYTLKRDVIFNVIASRCDIIGTTLAFASIMLSQLVDILNTLFKYWVGSWHDHWNVWTVGEKLCKVWLVIHEYSMRNCMFTWNSKLQSLNQFWTVLSVKLYQLFSCLNEICRICWTVAWILPYQVWEFGWNPYFRCSNTEVFLGDCFYWRTLYISSFWSS